MAGFASGRWRLITISVPFFTDILESVPINSLLKPFGKSPDSDSSVRVYFKPLTVMSFAVGLYANMDIIPWHFLL